MLDFSAAKNKAPAKEETSPEKKPVKEQTEEKPKRGRPAKADKAAPNKAKPPKPRDKKSQSKPIPEKPAVDKGGAPAGAEVTPEPFVPRDATRAEKEEIVYLSLSDLHPFKNHPFGVRDDAEMQGLVESVKAAGVNQPALVRPREDGGYEIIAGHRRQRASELAGFANMPCIVRNMTDDEAILAMTDDNLRHRERILPTEKAQSLKMQVEAIKHQGSRPGEEDKAKEKLKLLTKRNRGRNVRRVMQEVKVFIRGWIGYFRVANMKRTLMSWDEWMRRRFRMYIWKQWKKPKTKVANLRKLGIPADRAYQWGNSRLGYWRIAGSPILKCSITNERLAAAGYFSILNYYESLHLCG